MEDGNVADFFMTPNDRRQRRAGNTPAKKDDADRRVRCTPRLGGRLWLPSTA
jgi:hypothetical protein